MQKYRSFAKARAFVRKLKLKNRSEWMAYCKSGKKPLDIPTNPRVYKKEWNDYGDWLGTGYKKIKKFRSFVNARKFVRSLKLNGQKEWGNYSKSSKRPVDIPGNPQFNYKKEWVSWGDFLGTGNISNADKTYIPFKDARRFVRSLKIESQGGWSKYKKSGKKPNDIPGTPAQVYKEEWVDWGDWLGTGSIATQKIRQHMLPYEEAEKQARILCKKLNINNYDDWEKAWMQGKIPKNLPEKPWNFYSEKKGRER